MNARGSLLALLLLCAGSVAAQEKGPDPKPTTIDEATIKEWNDRGYDHVPHLATLYRGPRALSFVDDNDGATSVKLPGFRSRDPKSERGPPRNPNVPFALDAKPKHANLSQLVELESLVYLSLSKEWSSSVVPGPSIDDGHLEYVGELRGLIHLDLSGNHEIYGPGLKHLASLKKMNYLDLTRTRVTGAWLRHLKALLSLETLILAEIGPVAFSDDCFGLTDDGLKGLKELPQLRHLSLKNNLRITDAGLRHLSGLEKLVALNLRNKQLSDAGLKHLASLNHLTHLSLDGTAVTDDGLKQLVALKNLKLVSLRFTKVTDAGVRWLQKELPTCKIVK